MLDIRQAIETKYIGPTNTKGSRVKATCCARSKTFGWQSELNSEENHQAAALKLQVILDWAEHNSIIGGQLKDGRYVWVQIPRGKKK